MTVFCLYSRGTDHQRMMVIINKMTDRLPQAAHREGAWQEYSLAITGG